MRSNEPRTTVEDALQQVAEVHRFRGAAGGVGATVGGVIGSVLGGPIGAAIGARSAVRSASSFARAEEKRQGGESEMPSTTFVPLRESVGATRPDRSGLMGRNKRLDGFAATARDP